MIHPYVECFVDKVRVRALIDSGSMKSFISRSVKRTIDFDDLNLNMPQKEKCVSTTGCNVIIEGHLRSTVKGKRQQKFLLSHLKETLKVTYKSLLQNFYICFTLGDIVT